MRKFMKATARFIAVTSLLLANQAFAENVDNILVLMPDSSGAKSALVGLQEEVGEDLNLITQYVDSSTSIEDLGNFFKSSSPKAVVLMNNPTVNLYKKYQASLDPATKHPPALMMMASFLRQTSSGVQNGTGINYEIAAITCFVGLRNILDQPIRRVGVIYRDVFDDFINEQKAMAAQEKIEIVAKRLNTKNVKTSLKKTIKSLTKSDEVDAIWILNDNVLLNKNLLIKSWLPALKRNEKPVLVNVQSLVSSKFRFGSFAVLPDHTALGVQAANLLFDLQENDWQVGDKELEEPVAIEKVLLVPFAKKYLKLKENALDQIDVQVD
ncbi:MAG: hypothetical protein HOK28_02320 [Deltaproteobacteria bacterium]|jgi:hypothetical protein|nr:hypothetical protein [Deltaproteobacteria bacterium]